MAGELPKLLTALNKCVVENKSSEAKDHVLSISNIFEDELSKPELDSAFSTLFNESSGILKFLCDAYASENFRNAVVEVFEVLKYLIHNFRERMVSHVMPVMERCMLCIKQLSSAAAVKEKACDVLLLIFLNFSENFGGVQMYDSGLEMKQDIDVNNKQDLLMKRVMDELFQQLYHDKTTPKVLQKIYHILGVISSRFPHVIGLKSEKLLKIYCQTLEKQFRSNKVSYPIIAGCMEGLAGFLGQFAPTPDLEVCKKIYGFIKELSSNPDADQRVAHRAALRLIELHGFLFASYLFADYNWWHEQLLKWIRKSPDDHKAGTKALIRFYQEIAHKLQESSDEQHKAVFKHFIKYFSDKMLNEGVSVYEMGEVIKGLGYFAGSCMRHMTDEDMQVLFTLLIQRAHQVYINSSIQDQKHKDVQNLPDYIESMGKVILQLRAVTPDHLQTLQHATVFLFENFANVPEKFQSSSIEAFTSLFYSLSMCRGVIFEDFSKIFVYQGVLRTCSHHVAVDAELLKEQFGSQVITYKCYIPLWSSFLDPKCYKDVPLATRETIVCKLYDQLLQTVIILIQKLDLSTKKIDWLQNDKLVNENDSSLETVIKEYNHNEGFLATHPQDFQIFYNLVDLCADILPKCDPQLFEKWIQPFTYCIMMESSLKPNVSGFYRLLTVSLTVSEKLKYFMDVQDSLYKLVCVFLDGMLGCLKHYTGELQITCLQVLISTPVCMVPDLLHNAVEAFQAIFKIGRSYLKIARQGLEALEKWTKSVPSHDMKPFLKKVLPFLDSYLQSRGVGSETDKDLELVKMRSNSQRRRTLKRKLLTERPNSELQQLQRSILHFLGPLDADIAGTLLLDQTDSWSSWRNSRKLEFNLPFKDMKPSIYLDNLLPRITDLALTSSDRHTRIAACEILHAITMFMLGMSKQVADADDSELSELFQKMFLPLLQLGSDVDQIVYQLFHPLVLQLAHWFSSSFQLKSKNTATFVDTLFNTLTDPDSALRGTAAECLREFAVWAIKQHSTGDLDKAAVNIRCIIRRIRALCMHPGSSNRLGAALAFNYIYDVLREDKAVLDEYWLELLYYLMQNLAQTKPEEVMKGSVKELEESIKHIERVLKETADIFNKPSPVRRQPIAFGGSLLSDAVLWLLKQCSHHQTEYRQCSMHLVVSLAPHLPDCHSTNNFIKNFILSQDDESLVRVPQGSCINAQDISEWLKTLLASLMYYVWLIGDNLVSLELLKPQIIRIQEATSYFIHHVISKMESEDPFLHLSPWERNHYKVMKCSCIISLFNFLVTVFNGLNKSSTLDVSKENYFEPSHWQLIGSCLFTPMQVGFDLRCNKVLEKLPNALEQLLTALEIGLSPSYLEGSLHDILKENVTRHAVPILENATLILQNNAVSMEQQAVVKGLMILHKVKLLPIISKDLCEMGDRIVRKVFLALVEQPSGKVISLQPTVQTFGEALLKFAFSLEIKISELLECVLNDTEVKNPHVQSVVHHGEYFLTCFQQCLFEHLLTFPDDTINGLFARITPDNSQPVLVMEQFLHYAEEYKKQRAYCADRSAVAVLQHWAVLVEWAGRDSKNSTLMMVLLKQVAACSKQPIGCFMVHTHVQDWILDQLVSPNEALHYKNQALELLPCLTDSNHKTESTLRLAVQKLREQHFPQFSSELPFNSLQRDSFVVAFSKILEALKVTGSPVLLRCVIASSVGDTQHICEENIQKTLPVFIHRLNDEQQLHAVEDVYNIFWDDKLYDPKTRKGCVERFLIPLVRACRITVLEIFFTTHIYQMLEALLQKLDNSRSIRMEHQLVKSIGIWLLLELVFSCFSIEQLESKTCSITAAAQLGAVITGKELITDVSRKAFNVRNDILPARGKDFPDVVRFFRLMQCAAYKTLSVIVSNSKKEPKFYTCFLFSENRDKNQVLWQNLVDCDNKISFPMVWDNLPHRRKVLINIRKDVFKESSPVEFMPWNSQILFSSTLAEDVTRFDLSTSVVRETSASQEPQQSTEVELEVDSLNNHDCMATLCAIVQHLGKELPSEEPTSLPPWMDCLRKSIMNNPPNVRIFLTKVIINNQNVFEPFAKFWLNTIMQVIVDGCFGLVINYMVTDTIEMLVRWSSKAIPSSSETEKLLASKIVSFLMANASHSRRDIFKFNLELIKTVAEAWKSCVNFPQQFILDKMSSKGNGSKKDLELGIQLTGILLANNVQPWSSTGKEKFLALLSLNLGHDDRLIFKPCSEVIGMALKFIDPELTGELTNDEDAKFLDVIYKKLSAHHSKHIDVFLLCLHGIHKHYPLVVDKFINDVMYQLPKVAGILKRTCVELILSRVEVLGSSAFTELTGKGLVALLQNRDNDTQLLALRLVYKMLPNLETAHIQELLDVVLEVISLKNVKCRAIGFQILMWAYDNNIVREKDRSALIAGLLDSDLDLKDAVTKFWDEKHFPYNTPSHLSVLLTELYSPDIEDDFLSYATRLLMNAMKLSPDYEMKIFSHPLTNCSFQELQLLVSWRARHTSIAPMFADTFSSQLSRVDSLDCSSLPKLRATQASLAFQPTLAIDMDRNASSSMIQDISISSTNSSLLFNVASNITYLTNRNIQQNISAGSESPTMSKPHRFLRDQRKISSMHAKRQVKKAILHRELQEERIKKQEATVAMYRTYRKGDVPDIEIPYSAILKPLQALAEHDAVTGRLLFVSIVCGVMNKLTGDEVKLFADQINTALRNIVEKTYLTTPMFIGAVLEIALAHNERISLDTDSILKVSKASGLCSLGILLLEAKLIAMPTMEPAAKKGTRSVNEEDICWLRLAELYQSLDEWDVVHGVFSQKLKCHDSAKMAIEAESDRRWDDAQDFYKDAIDSRDPDNQKDFCYEAYYKCLANLSKWDTLLACIHHQLDGDLDSLWEDEWNKSKLLPWQFISELQLMGSRDCSQFLTALQKWSSNKEQYDYMKTYFNEELTVLYILNKDIVSACSCINDSYRMFLDKWSQLKVSAFKQRALILQDLHRQAELSMFLHFFEIRKEKHIGNLSDDEIQQLCTQWCNSLPCVTSCLMDWDRRLTYRNQFATQLKENLRYDLPCLERAATQMQLAIIDCALNQCNFHVARKYLLETLKLSNSPSVQVRLELGYSKCDWLTSKKTTGAARKLKLIMKAWERLRQCEWNECHDLQQVAYQQISVYARDIWQLLEDDHSLLEEVEIAESLCSWTNSSVSDLKEAVNQHGFDCLQEAVKIAEKLNTTGHDIANAYYKVAEYCQEIYSGQSDGPHIVKSVLRAMRYGSSEARHLFPCLLQIEQLAADWKEHFERESAEVPEWMFLVWVNQLLACLNVPIGKALHTLIWRLAEMYPQAIAYPFRVSCEKYTFSTDPESLRTKDLVARLEAHLLRDPLIDTFLWSLSCLVLPEILLRYHLRKLIAVAIEMPVNLEQFEVTYCALISKVYEDRTVSVEARGEAFNVLNNFREPLTEALELMRSEEISQGVAVLKNIQQTLVIANSEKKILLQNYSPWLHQFQGSQWAYSLELPGQYSGESCPLPQHHTKIASFYPQALVMKSIRHPFKITILGNDAKEYRYLVKFEEDLRQDQRIEQLFDLMNKILNLDPACHHRKLQIITYKVIPLSCTLGMVQWLDGTETFKKLLSNVLTKEEEEEWDTAIDLHETWLRKASPKEKLSLSQLYGNAYLKYSRLETITAYKEKVNLIPWDIFKRAVFSLSLSQEDFFIRRHNFACSYAVLSIAHWLLGIGDRHLDNCMLLKSNCCSVGIDFGHAFGTATQILSVPELMPFRLTPHILNLLLPQQEIGLITGTMMHCLRALRSSCHVLVATMDVFAQEPTLDWLEQARRQRTSMEEASGGDDVWYPQQKVLLARRKLEGANPAWIMCEELKTGNSRSSQYLPKFLEVAKGDPQHNVRARLPEDHLTPHQQVECLLDMATDPHILGKTYQGWNPWM